MTMKMTISYGYDNVKADKLLQIVKEFEDELYQLDPGIVCLNFQIESDEVR